MPLAALTMPSDRIAAITSAHGAYGGLRPLRCTGRTRASRRADGPRPPDVARASTCRRPPRRRPRRAAARCRPSLENSKQPLHSDSRPTNCLRLIVGLLRRGRLRSPTRRCRGRGASRRTARDPRLRTARRNRGAPAARPRRRSKASTEMEPDRSRSGIDARRTVARMRSAISAASSIAACGRRMTNSSPAYRPMIPDDAASSRSVPATTRSTASPCRWPCGR